MYLQDGTKAILTTGIFACLFSCAKSSSLSSEDTSGCLVANSSLTKTSKTEDITAEAENIYYRIFSGAIANPPIAQIKDCESQELSQLVEAYTFYFHLNPEKAPQDEELSVDQQYSYAGKVMTDYQWSNHLGNQEFFKRNLETQYVILPTANLLVWLLTSKLALEKPEANLANPKFLVQIHAHVFREFWQLNTRLNDLEKDEKFRFMGQEARDYFRNTAFLGMDQERVSQIPVVSAVFGTKIGAQTPIFHQSSNTLLESSNFASELMKHQAGMETADLLLLLAAITTVDTAPFVPSAQDQPAISQNFADIDTHAFLEDGALFRRLTGPEGQNELFCKDTLRCPVATHLFYASLFSGISVPKRSSSREFDFAVFFTAISSVPAVEYWFAKRTDNISPIDRLTPLVSRAENIAELRSNFNDFFLRVSSKPSSFCSMLIDIQKLFQTDEARTEAMRRSMFMIFSLAAMEQIAKGGDYTHTQSAAGLRVTSAEPQCSTLSRKWNEEYSLWFLRYPQKSNQFVSQQLFNIMKKEATNEI